MAGQKQKNIRTNGTVIDHPKEDVSTDWCRFGKKICDFWRMKRQYYKDLEQLTWFLAQKSVIL